MQHRQPQQQQVPDLPERVGPFTAHEPEINGVDTFPHHEVYKQVAEEQHHQQNTGQAHAQPGEHLKVIAFRGGSVVLDAINLVIADARDGNAGF